MYVCMDAWAMHTQNHIHACMHVSYLKRIQVKDKMLHQLTRPTWRAS